MEKKILDIGCGNNKIRGAIGLDIGKDTQADIVWEKSTNEKRNTGHRLRK